ncbi:MAG: choice-of-anchor Q domain-containing protein [Wenzhouxiangella sp.]|nr:choice-of-anchor Q domain-containing protein [Wenzhouxiangella sp.]
MTTPQIQTALDAGGPIVFDLGSDPTILVVEETLVASRETVIDGGGLVTLSGGGVRQILRITNPDPAENAPHFTVTLQNIRFINGRTDGGRGGAIYKEHGFEFPHKVSLKLVNCHFANNHAPLDGTSQDDGGGALYAELMNRIDISNCAFDGNSGSNGGALYSLVSLHLNVVDSVFSNNQAIGTGGNPGNGGNAGAFGVDGPNRLVDICRTRFEGNRSNAFGAGFFSVMYDQTSRTRFEDVTFRENIQLSDTEHTGGAYIQDGPWAMERVSFVDNEARGYGGLFVAGNAPGRMRNATFSRNIARTGLGGAMGLSSTPAIEVINSTIANNVATEAFAGGIAIGTPNQLSLTNTIFANNSGGNRFVGWAMNNPANQSGGGNLQWPEIRPDGGGSETPVTMDAIFTEPMLSPLASDNGGQVPTLAIDIDSPAVNAGVTGLSVPNTDARGQPRDSLPDSGSFEFIASGMIFKDRFEHR